MGKRNAAVLPLPVLAIPITSRPPRMAGMPEAWIGVGEENSDLRMAFISGSSNPKCAKLLTGLGGDGPDTVMLSFCCRSMTCVGQNEDCFSNF